MKVSFEDPAPKREEERRNEPRANAVNNRKGEQPDPPDRAASSFQKRSKLERNEEA
jgi:hypothetical protein